MSPTGKLTVSKYVVTCYVVDRLSLPDDTRLVQLSDGRLIELVSADDV